MINHEDFFHMTTPDDNYVPPKLGTIPSNYVNGSGRPKIIFDGEATASTKTYPYLSSYTPAANDRVVLMKIGNCWVVFGKII